MSNTPAAAPPLQADLDLSQFSVDKLEELLNKKRESERVEREQSRKSYEDLRDKEIARLSQDAIALSATIKVFKEDAFKSMRTLYELLQEHSKRHADGKGNFSIEAGSFKINYRRQENGSFDERSVQAEKHIIDFVTEKFKDQKDTRELIMSLLERKKGALDIKLVQKLYAMEDRFTEDNWKQGIRLLKESWRATETKDYITFDQKGKDNEWHTINLNFAGL